MTLSGTGSPSFATVPARNPPRYFGRLGDRRFYRELIELCQPSIAALNWVKARGGPTRIERVDLNVNFLDSLFLSDDQWQEVQDDVLFFQEPFIVDRDEN